MEFAVKDLIKEVSFKTSRSGGKGGQNVNKVSSKVELNLNIQASGLFTGEQKQILMKKLANKINSEGILQVITEEERSQLLNKQKSLVKLQQLIKNALFVPPARKATKPKHSAIESRLRTKHLNALKKISRRDFFRE
ncbi:MAG: alternative ribosome rescue aminoacyl-tRNA hydrolase ArfB [Daejeonella sp.]|uniref:alternative ribosome rescue aminoacyl-tRNA hydrolase ArfB n=1 Tax=Daejeonella sp. TaxID=2805397 RepID=UPI002732FD9D|nr:alternative ribosome rescue aminoacyl-tRNA hydrolase ArfB [Daejeonella sp.]MDP3470169.1 alternative ribosome rescue aminoacyl-tRNA hydrolase ArfB [Daejeonella sp.]